MGRTPDWPVALDTPLEVVTVSWNVQWLEKQYLLHLLPKTLLRVKLDQVHESSL